MKLVNPDLEISTILSMCSGGKVGSTVMSMVNADHFYYGPTKEVHSRIVKVTRASGELPTLSDVVTDPAISEDTRKLLRKSTVKVAKNVESARKLVKRLDEFRKLRGLYFRFENGLQTLQKESVDLDELIEDTSDTLMKLRSTAGVEQTLQHIGKGNNTTNLVKRMLSSDAPPVIRTGFTEYDERNGGFFFGALVTLAATTGGGKSTVADQLAHNIPLLNQNTDAVLVSLEMTEEDCVSRKLSRLGRVPVNKFQQRKVTDAEAKKVKKAYAKYVNALKENNSRSTIFSPTEDMSIEEILFALKPYGYRVIIIDYISLLKGMDGDDQWRMLGNAARFCKIWAKTHNIVVIVLAQLDENNPMQIRYSRAIKEHSNNMWAWTCTEDNKETGLIEIRQLKARNQDPFPFYLGIDFEHMDVRDPDSEQLEEAKHSQSAEKNKKKLDKVEKELDDDYLQDISDDED